jgi:hypothetical protein
MSSKRMRSAVTRQLSLVTPQIALAIRLFRSRIPHQAADFAFGQGQADAIDGFTQPSLVLNSMVK